MPYNYMSEFRQPPPLHCQMGKTDGNFILFKKKKMSELLCILHVGCDHSIVKLGKYLK